jgi:hypothetical protein
MIKTLKDLKMEYGKELKGIKKYEDLKSLASNFIRMITWKKEKDLEYITVAYVGVIASVIKDIRVKGYDEALKAIKQGNLHKAFNIKYIYNYYGLNYDDAKQALKMQKMDILG